MSIAMLNILYLLFNAIDNQTKLSQNCWLDLDAEISRKRKEMRAKHKTVIVPEDEPSFYKQELHKRSVKVSYGL